MSDNGEVRTARLQALREEMICLLREELLDLFRDEWRRGCDNAAIPGGMDAVRGEYEKIAPPGVFVVLRYYAALDNEGRQKALRIAGKLLRSKALTKDEVAWVGDVSAPLESRFHARPEAPAATTRREVERRSGGLRTGYSARELENEERRERRGAIKGNINHESGEKIYHMPGQKWYEETVIRPEDGERWFHSEEEAEAAGWRRSFE